MFSTTEVTRACIAGAVLVALMWMAQKPATPTTGHPDAQLPKPPTWQQYVAVFLAGAVGALLLQRLLLSPASASSPASSGVRGQHGGGRRCKGGALMPLPTEDALPPSIEELLQHMDLGEPDF